MPQTVLPAAVHNTLISLQNAADAVAKSNVALSPPPEVETQPDEPATIVEIKPLAARAGDLSAAIDVLANAAPAGTPGDDATVSAAQILERALAAVLQSLRASGSLPVNQTITGADAAFLAEAIAAAIGSGAVIDPGQAGGFTGTGANIFPDAPAVVTGSTSDIAGQTDLISATAIAQGDTLEINGATITFGTGQGEVNSGAALKSAIDTIPGLSARYNNTNALVISAIDADTSIELRAGTKGAALRTLGVNASVTEPANLLTQGAVGQGETLVIKIGAHSNPIAFGTGPDNVSTLADLSDKLNAITGGSASIDRRGNISVAVKTLGDTTIISGTAALSKFGLQTAENHPDGLSSRRTATQGEARSIPIGKQEHQNAFGQSLSEISIFTELDAALRRLTGGAVSVDAGGIITVTPAEGPDAADNAVTAVAGNLGIAAAPVKPSGILSEPADIPGNNTLIRNYFDNGAAGVVAPVDTDGEFSVTAINSLGATEIDNSVPSDISRFLSALLSLADGDDVPDLQSVLPTPLLSTLSNLTGQPNGEPRVNGANPLKANGVSQNADPKKSVARPIAEALADFINITFAPPATGAAQNSPSPGGFVTDIDAAAGSVRQSAAVVNAGLSAIEIRQDFTRSLINPLESDGSSVTRPDRDEDAAGVLASLTRAQLASVTMSVATPADQNVLRLI